MKNYLPTTNDTLCALISYIKSAQAAKSYSVLLQKCQIAIDLVEILKKEGVIVNYKILKNAILVILMYRDDGDIFAEFTIMSRPGKRDYKTLRKLALIYNNNNFSGFYIVSTQKGILTSHACLLSEHVSGEILAKVSI